MSDIRNLFDRWTSLENDKDELASSSRDLFVEAKSQGFNPKALRAAFRFKRKREEGAMEFDAHQEEIDTYLVALGTVPATRALPRDARVEATPPHDPETGEITGIASGEGATPAPVHRGAAPAGDESAAPIHPKPTAPRDAGEMPAFLRRASVMASEVAA